MYTDEDIRNALKNYRNRTDKVTKVLELVNLNSMGINTIVHVSKDFQLVDKIIQEDRGEAVVSTIEKKVNTYRELLLGKSEDKDRYLINILAGTPLELQNDPFVFVYYGKEVYDYVNANSRVEKKYKRIEIRRTLKDIRFHFINEHDVNSIGQAKLKSA